MNQNNALQVQGQSLVTTVNEMKDVAGIFAASGYFQDAKAMAQAFVKIATGRELGFHPMASMTGISIIEGKPAFGANLMASKIRTSGYDYRVKELTNDNCSIEFFSPAKESLGISSFSMADAKVAGLGTKSNWVKYTRNMLFARAVSNGIRFYCPEIMQGTTVYTPDELGATVDEDGNSKMEIRADYSVGNETPGTEDPYSGGETPTPPQAVDPIAAEEHAQRKEIGEMIMEMVSGEKKEAGKLLKELTCRTVDGKKFPGASSIKDLFGEYLVSAHTRVTEAHTAWKSKTTAPDSEPAEEEPDPFGDVFNQPPSGGSSED